jgi:hypothetical protein
MNDADGKPMSLIVVKYKYGTPRPNVTSSASLTVQGTTEAAVLAELQRLRPSHKNIIITSIEVKRP